MKHPYLLQNISARLHTPIRIYGNDSASPVTYSNIPDFSDAPYGEHLLETQLLRDIDLEHPVIVSVGNLFAYALLLVEEETCLVGPVRFDILVQLRYVISVQDSAFGEAVEPDQELLSGFAIVTFDEFILDLMLLANFDREEGGEAFLTRETLIAENCVPAEMEEQYRRDLTQTLFENVENGFVHNPYNREAREVASIENGDVEGLKRALDEDFTGRFGVLSRDPVRQEQHMGVVSITLASRAAIRSGLHPEIAFYISDINIQRLDQCHDVPTLKHIARAAEVHYAQLVHELKATRQDEAGNVPQENLHISHCKDYVFSHLHGKLTVGEIADAIGLEPNYLSALFRKQEGITLKQYILNEKINLIRNLLSYSSYPYVQIASYLGFSSQSHMGAEFKKATGYTPREYRERFGREDFIGDNLFQV